MTSFHPIKRSEVCIDGWYKSNAIHQATHVTTCKAEVLILPYKNGYLCVNLS
jgi:hypothetical protein